MIEPNRTVNCSPMFSLLSEDQIQQLHYATLDVLERVGVVFQHPKALEILRSLGCRVEGQDRVRIPPHLVEEALRWTPPCVPVYDRTGALRMKLEGRRVYFGAGLTCASLVEADGTRRPYTSAECAKNSLVADALDHIDFTMAMAHTTDFPVERRDILEIATILRNSVKPIIITAHSAENLDTIVEMAGLFAGSKAAFLERPFLMYYTEPVSPLQHTALSLNKLFRAVEYGLPILNTPAPMAGATAPVTLTGALLSGFAEMLSGLVLIQNCRKGTPVIFGGVFTTLDMRHMTFTYGSPELQLMNTAAAQMAQHYRIPSFGTAGATDAHELDEQAAFECGVSMLLNALSGSNLVHDVGWLSGATATSNELLVLCDEMIGYTQRFMDGVDTSNIEESVEELAAVGPGGNFLDREMTAKLFRKEFWLSKVLTRPSYATWSGSEKTPLRVRLKAEVDRIVKMHRPPELSASAEKAVEEILRR